MPKGGNNRKPTELKLLHGTFRKDRENPDEPKPDPLTRKIDPPRYITGHVARKAWREAHEMLDRLGILKETDWIALDVLVRMYARWREAAEQVELSVYETEKGYRAADPTIGIELKYAKELRTWLQEFGMTPSSRSRVHVGKEGEGEIDPMEGMLSGQG